MKQRKIRLRRRIRYPFAYAFYRLVMAPLAVMPHRVVCWLAAAGARLLYLLPGARRILLANLAIAFPDLPEAERRTIARRSLRHLLLSYLDFGWYRTRLHRLPEVIRMDSHTLDVFRHHQTTGQGAIFVSPHLGNWEVGFQAINQFGLSSAAVARKLPNPYLERDLTAARTATGGHIWHERGAAKGMVATLKAGNCLFLLVDQNTRPRHGGIFVPFFGLPASMSRAPAMLARRQQVPLYVSCCLRQPDGTYLAHCHPIDTHDIAQQTDETISHRINQATETLVRAHPDQYLWLYERWRYLPDTHPTDNAPYPFYAIPYHDYRDLKVKKRQ